MKRKKEIRRRKIRKEGQEKKKKKINKIRRNIIEAE